MYFKRLELVGFKSFADKTTIEFEPGVTAIVGPNGCGKSNISDAIRWVLGEQSAKSLRGASMEDVIFNGSATKEPLNLAEVSLTLSNESKILPIDYDEVTITRRLYRSGESEYLLNKNNVRLKDINELLMGTGIGTESYSIIEQGKMDQILNSKPEDRRVIFEEAAGITKYKSKKKEALRKLEQTDANLLRINDIIQEVKRQIGSIERQAKKAESYKAEFEKLKKLELAVASREFLLFDHKRKTREASLVDLKKEEEASHSLMQAAEADYADKKRELSRIDAELQDSRARETDTASGIRKNQDRLLLNRERIGELSQRKEQLLRQTETLKRRIEKYKEEYNQWTAEFEILQKEETEARAFLDSVEGDFKALADAVAGLAAGEKAGKARLFDLANGRAHVQSELASVRAENGVLEKRSQRLNEKKDIASNEGRRAGERLTALQSAVKKFKDKLKALLQALTQKQASEFGPAEESELESEIKSFVGEVSKMQTEEKWDEEFSLLSAELSDLDAERGKLSGREKELVKKLETLAAEEKTLQAELGSVENAFKDKAGEKEALLVHLTETRSKQSHCTAKREKIEKDKTRALEAMMSEEAQELSLVNEVENATAKKESLEEENKLLETELQNLSSRRDGILKSTEGTRRDREAIATELETLEKAKNERQEFLREALGKVHGFELEQVELRHEMDRLRERIFNAYQVDLIVGGNISETQRQAEAALSVPEEFDAEEAKIEIQFQREKLNKMGPVNLVAIQEYDEMKERFDFLTKQQQDLLQAKEDIHKAILKINRTTKELFIDTFGKIQKHFTEYYRLLFGGGSAELLLLDEDDVLECGIEIVARPPGKKLQSITLLSGGEKALTAIALLFSLFKVKPSPFCVLDEIDAPLDESNVDRFCGVLRDFITGSQFILITHNKRTMNLADVMYGITMAEAAISKIVSVRFSEKADHKKTKDKTEEAVAA